MTGNYIKATMAQPAAQVLGYSCRLPESGSPSEFWENLVTGESLNYSYALYIQCRYFGTFPRQKYMFQRAVLAFEAVSPDSACRLGQLLSWLCSQ